MAVCLVETFAVCDYSVNGLAVRKLVEDVVNILNPGI